MILEAGFTSKGVRIKIEGVFLGFASAFGSPKRRCAPNCAVWSRKGTQFGTQSPDAGGYVRGAGRPMIALAPWARLPFEG